MSDLFATGSLIGKIRNFGSSRRYVMGITSLQPGEVEYTTPGTYLWTCPENVFSVCAVAVGAGGGPAANASGASGAGGGGLGWANDIPVVPGQQYTVEVGAGGTRVTTGTAPAGGDSYFIDIETVAGLGGLGGICAADANRAGGGFVGDGGGTGGAGGSRSATTAGAGGGGGAGGYAGVGGRGGNFNATATSANGLAGAGGGGGGGGGCGTGDTAGAGGGVGIYGQGANGALGAGSTTDGHGGGGGSGGTSATNAATTTATTNHFSTSNLSTPGRFGGGGAGADNTTVEQAEGGGGAVRIIWGGSRAFPSTNTADGQGTVILSDIVGNLRNSGVWDSQAVFSYLASQITSIRVIASTIVAGPGATVTSINVTVPSGVQTGDMILILAGNDHASSTQQFNNTTFKPTGFTLIDTAGSSTADAYTASFYKIADGSEGGTTINVPAATAQYMWAGCAIIRGVDINNPIGPIGAKRDNSSATTHPLTGVTTTRDNCVAFFTLSSDGSDVRPFGVSGDGWLINNSLQTGVGNSGTTVGGIFGWHYIVDQGTPTNDVTIAYTGAGGADGGAGFQFVINGT
jgi:hypothetical protein